MTKQDLNDTYPQIQPYRKYFKKNSIKRNLAVPTKTQATSDLTTANP